MKSSNDVVDRIANRRAGAETSQFEARVFRYFPV